MAPLRWLSARFELDRHGDGASLLPMEGLRGMAAWLVFLVHFTTLSQAWLPDGALGTRLWRALDEVGHCGVDLFFVLSGYLIYGSLIARPRPFGPYFKRRLQRIYPTFLVVFAVYLLLFLAVPAYSKLPDSLGGMVQYLLINLLLLPGILPFEPMITVAWSLSYEVFFYLLVPVLIGALGLRNWSRQARCVLIGLLATAIVVYSAVFGGHVRLVLFLSGMLLHETLASRRKLAVPDAVLWAAVALGLVLTVVRPDGSAGYAMRAAVLFGAFFLLCFGAFTRPDSSVARVFSWTPLRWLGNMSYSYYLIHGLTLRVLFVGFGWLVSPQALTWPAMLALMALAFAVTLLPSAVLFLAVERPLSLGVPRKRVGGATGDARAVG